MTISFCCNVKNIVCGFGFCSIIAIRVEGEIYIFLFVAFGMFDVKLLTLGYSILYICVGTVVDRRGFSPFSLARSPVPFL